MSALTDLIAETRETNLVYEASSLMTISESAAFSAKVHKNIEAVCQKEQSKGFSSVTASDLNGLSKEKMKRLTGHNSFKEANDAFKKAPLRLSILNIQQFRTKGSANVNIDLQGSIVRTSYSVSFDSSGKCKIDHVFR